MNRLGGRTITTADVKSSSMAKGETLADTARIWSGYADLMVIRHPWEGAARLAADKARMAELKASIRGRMAASDLCDTEAHGRTPSRTPTARSGATGALGDERRTAPMLHVKHRRAISLAAGCARTPDLAISDQQPEGTPL